MSSDNPKLALFTQFADVAKALGHAHRLALIEQMAQGARSVEVLADRAGISVANASQHLRQLRSAGLTTSRRAGKQVLYSLSDPAVLDLMAALQHIAERNLAEVDRILGDFFHARDAMEPVSRAELLDRLRDGAVTLLDVRPEDEFALGHVAGAINLPLDSLEGRLGSLDPNSRIVAYCRGAYCVLAFEAVARLRRDGFDVRRLEDGFPEWKAAGLPVEADDG